MEEAPPAVAATSPSSVVEATTQEASKAPLQEEMKEDDATTKQQDDETPSPEKEDDAEEDAADNKAAAVLSRPVKRARTAYFLFAEDRRKEVQLQYPGQGVAAVAKGLGVLWAGLTDEEKKVYQDKAAEEKERLAEELRAWKEAGGELVEQELLPAASNNTDALIFPYARVRKICRLDPDVRGISKEAVALVTKAAEVFAAKIGNETMRVAAIQNRRKLQAADVAQVCASREQFLFLREDLADLTRQQQKESQQEKDSTSKRETKIQPPPFAGKPLTSYFSVKEK